MEDAPHVCDRCHQRQGRAFVQGYWLCPGCNSQYLYELEMEAVGGWDQPMLFNLHASRSAG